MRVTFITLLKGNWFLGNFIFHKLLSLYRCPVSGSLVGASRWLPIDGFGAFGSALQARQQICYYLWYMFYSKDFISSQTGVQGITPG
jgi:hypothetical protein